jgi:hypothetical protein
MRRHRPVRSLRLEAIPAFVAASGNGGPKKNMSSGDLRFSRGRQWPLQREGIPQFQVPCAEARDNAIGQFAGTIVHDSLGG